MTEDDLRGLLGYSTVPEVSFAGRQWKIRKDGLAALLRYSRSSVTAGADNDQAPLAALHRFLEDVIADFAAFSDAAFTGKAPLEEVVAVSKAAVEFYCCRSYWPAMRLIAVVGDGMEEMDGNLLRQGGAGLASLSAREACNLALAVCLDGRSEEDRDIFLEDLAIEYSPEGEAMSMVRQMQAEAKERADGER